ncbi:MAG TPA: peptidoglycan editing factor PgeF [Rhodanobacteraceae bacterium]|nr:peptidoglycan editing factor PgeF [Rhodanobacteraceae bacterium]
MSAERDRPGLLWPDWPAPPMVRAVVTTRWAAGCSQGAYALCNLGRHSGDEYTAVTTNRAALRDALALPREPLWLRQVHGRGVVDADAAPPVSEPEADAAISRTAGRVLAILSADCLPVLLAAVDGCEVAAVHAGWRGLSAGVLEATIAALRTPPARLLAWLGPCIGAVSYEVGAEVRAAFVDADAGAAATFTPTRPGHWTCDLAALARRRLHAAGVTRLSGGDFDTRADPRFYSYRRDGASSGRFASLIWRQ